MPRTTHRRDGTGEVALPDGTVADDHDFIQEVGILSEGDGGRDLGGLEDLGRVADAADFDHRIRIRDGEDEVAIDARGGSVRRALLHDGGSDDRTHGVHDDTFNLVSALGEHGRADCEQYCDCG